VVRRKIFWAFFALSLLNFTFHSAVIYGITQVRAGSRGIPFFERMAKIFTFTGTGESYKEFIFSQGLVVMIMLVLAGWFLVGSELRARSLPFYLSRPIGRLEYFLGKLAAASSLAALITLVPAAILFLQYGAFTESLDYYLENLAVLGAIAGYGGLVSVVPAIILLGLWALLRRMVPVIMAWGALFILLPALAGVVRIVYRERELPDPWQWGLLDIWTDLRWISNVLFEVREEIYLERWPWAAGALGLACLVSVLAFWRRISAVEVVR